MMKKHRILYFISLVVLSTLLAVGCSKANPANKETDGQDNIENKADTQETVTEAAEQTESTAQSEITQPAESTKSPESMEAAGEGNTAGDSDTTNTEQTETIDPEDNPVSQDNTQPAGDTEPADITEAVEPEESSELETIQETVLCDRDGIRITAKEVINDWMWGKGMNILIENNTDKNIGLMAEKFSVNNFMITDSFSCGVTPRTSQTETLSLCSVGISVIGINTIAEVMISLNVFDNDTGQTLFYTDETPIRTSAYGTFEQQVEVMKDGKELINQNGIRILGKYVNADSPWGMAVLLYIDNESEQDVIVQCDEMTVNGFSMEPYYSNQIDRGRKALQSVQLLDQDLTANNITEVKDIVIKFSLGDPATYSVIYTTEPIQIAVGE